MMDYVGYSANNPILHDVASCLTRDSSCSILKDVSIFVSKTFRRMGFPSMTDKLICVFLAIKYGPYFLATLVGRVRVLAAQHSTNVPLSWFEHNDQEKKTGPRMPMLSVLLRSAPFGGAELRLILIPPQHHTDRHGWYGS